MFKSHFCIKIRSFQKLQAPLPTLFFSQRLFIHIKIHKNVCKGAQNYHITQRGDHIMF